MKKLFHLTQEGIEELRAELSTLIAKRRDIAEKLQIARDYGDLSENAEYHNARDEQASVEMRIKEIENILQNSDVIKNGKSTKVGLGSSVELSGNSGNKNYTVVGSVEANPLEGRISNESPIGRALIGKSVGEEVEISTPSSKTLYTIKEIK